MTELNLTHDTDQDNIFNKGMKALDCIHMGHVVRNR